MGIPELIGRLLPGPRAVLPASPPEVSQEEEARRESDRELEAMIQDLIRERLAAGEATIIANDPDTAELIAGEMGVTIPPEALAAARQALEERRLARRAAAMGGSCDGYPLAASYDPERFRSLGREAMAVLQKFARYGDDWEGEHRDGTRLLAIADELSYGGSVQEWKSGSRRDFTDPRYPWPELAWLPGYLLNIGRDMVRHSEPYLGRGR